MSPRSPKQGDRATILGELSAELERLGTLESIGASTRDRVEAAIAIRRLLDDYGASLYPEVKSGKTRIIAYLKEHVGQVVHSEELAVISGIQDHARRIRELNTEQGYRIVSGVDREDLAPDEYMLLSM